MADQTNPKDLLGIKKVPMNLLPAAGRIEGARAMQHGAEKYGPYNWREKKIIASIYMDAIERHLLALLDGEDTAADSGVSHLGHIIANASIILDAKEYGNLVDDRPKAGPAPKMLDRYDQSKKLAQPVYDTIQTNVSSTVTQQKENFKVTPNGKLVAHDFAPCSNYDCFTCKSLGYRQ